MAEFQKIKYFDLAWEAAHNRLPALIGREQELERLERTISRKIDNNCLIVGPSGIGKTSLILEFAQKNSAQTNSLPIILMTSESFYDLTQPAAFIRYEEAFQTLPPAIIIIDDFGALIYNKTLLLQNMVRLLTPLRESRSFKLILSLTPEELQWFSEHDVNFTKKFEILTLKEQPYGQQLEILKSTASTTPTFKLIPEQIFKLIIELSQRFPILGQLPRAGLKLWDESLQLASNMREVLGEGHVYRVVADKTGIPLNTLQTSELDKLKNLELTLQQQIVGQNQALATFAHFIRRAKLQLRNPHRPLGSFLVLGPSGVGKTETAKVLAAEVFGRKENFYRLDMSEFSEAHTVSRLIGSPPGYVGHETPGALISAAKNEPHSLILMDEVEKAHPRIFDVFLQLLDDGRLTSAQGEAADFTQTIIIATSNLASREISNAYQKGISVDSQEFLDRTIMPILTAYFRTEFLNRFDAIVIFKPLSLADLTKIALLEIAKIEKRLSKHQIQFEIDHDVLKQKITEIYDPKFGARPIKRFMEELCESLVTKQLLNYGSK
ncbi:MAG: ATP-dependent Clp protease ATP-binding subunit [Candidatus Doudnabacteria bacterium]|nr:ATP-dependent Clp protease ATP-binding subunit [Candidatus Doudnabacteria bacterium]